MEKYIEALQKLPLCRPAVIGLAWKFTRPDGSLDEDLMSFHIEEIREAGQEARAIVNSTREAVRLLWRLQRSTS
ncbi:MAG TPA: hypothetical protein VMW64_00950 [Dehalococcoidia bacterium]|nr:hypothetical protein [Dehalococcoidia bacterium]